MAVDVVMPRLSDSMEEGTVVRWLKAPGEVVSRGEDLVEIETDKATMVYEADGEGTLLDVLADEGDTAPIGQVIARLGDPGEAAQHDAAGVQAEAQERTENKIRASPLARRMARELGIEISTVPGSGPGGRIIRADVESASAGSGRGADAPTPTAPQASPVMPVEREAPESVKGSITYQELTKLQSTVARRMAEAKATAPHFYLSADVDMGRMAVVRDELRTLTAEAGGRAPSFNDLVIKAAAVALRAFPRANGTYRDGQIQLFERINIGVAVATEDALIVPTIFDADRKGLGEIAGDAHRLVERVRGGTITPPELSGGTFTVSNLGMFGIREFAAVINPPQAAILAVGAIEERPVVRDGEVVTGRIMTLTLACDHRVLYGADGAKLLAHIRALLERPLSIAL